MTLLSPEDIAHIPMFQGLPEIELDQLTQIATDETYAKGASIFLEGEDGDGFYVVLSGRVKIFKLSAEGKEQTLHLFGTGEPFGEVALFSGSRFPANAEALEESRVLFFPTRAFADLIRKNPSVAMNMLAVLSIRLRRFTVLIEDLSLKEVPGRFAAYLLYLSKEKKGSQELFLDITKAQLASLLGTIPETLSRILGRMSRHGLIQSDGRRIKILDQERLKEMAEWGG